MTYEQGIRIASRTFAAYLLFWVVDDLTELPRELHSVMHYVHQASGLGLGKTDALEGSYLLRLYLLYLAGNILRIALWLVAAGWFYRCGPGIQRFLGMESGVERS